MLINYFQPYWVPLILSLIGALFLNIKRDKWIIKIIVLHAAIDVIVAPFVSIYFEKNDFIFFIYPVVLIMLYVKYISQENKLISDKVNLTLNLYGFLSFILLLIYSTKAIGINFAIGLIITIAFLVIYFKEKLKEPFDIHLTRIPTFWFAMGIFFFTATNLPYLIFLDEIRYSPEIGKPLYGMVTLGNIFLSLGYLMTVLCHLRNNFLLKKSSMPVS